MRGGGDWAGHIVNLVLFVFVYLAPFVYTTNTKSLIDPGLIARSVRGRQSGEQMHGLTCGGSCHLVSLLLCVVFYGLEAMCFRIMNPFGWDREGALPIHVRSCGPSGPSADAVVVQTTTWSSLPSR
jgi:hypothetical protein